MSVNVENISLGLGNLELGSFTATVFDGYTDVGAIKSEVNIEHTREVLDFESGRPLVTLLQEVIRESVAITATLAELSLATLKMALGQGNITSGTTTSFLDGSSDAMRGDLQSGKVALGTGNLFKFGGTPTHAYVGLRFTHRKASGKRIIFEGYKASPQGALTLPFRDSDWNMFTVNFRLLADTNRAAGEQYYQLFIET
ncbi:MAG: hypothetical protein WC554_08690 [Clostridia bacterium]|jgi:hypothetical protein